MSQIHRRQFLLATGALLAIPAGAIAQQESRHWRVGVLSDHSAPTSAKPDPFMGPFVQGMRDLGYAEGRNLAIEWHFAGGDFKRLSEITADLVRRKVDIIVIAAGGTRAAKAAQMATPTIPIVTSAVGDPVRAGLADSLARPGRNITGITNIAGELELKRFEVLREILPKIKRVGYLSNPDIEGSIVDVKKMGNSLERNGLTVVLLNARDPQGIDSAFVEIARQKLDGVVIATEATFFLQVEKLASLSLKMKLPAAMGFPEAADAGLLVSYGSAIPDRGRQSAALVDKILKGAKPGDIPIERPTRFELVLNLRTARAFGIAVAKPVILRADRVIE